MAPGAVEITEDHVDVGVALRNDGDAAVGRIDVDGELFGNHSHAEVADGVPASQTRSVTLRFPPDVPQPGTHALSLLLGYAPAGASTPVLSQRGYLLLAFGAPPPEALRVSVRETRLDWAGTAIVTLESTDGRAHRAGVRLQGPTGFRVNDPDDPVAVPARGKVDVKIPVFRGTLPWDTVQGVLAIATTVGEEEASTAVASGTARIAPDPAWLPRIRKPLVLLALTLLGIAVFAEAWKRLA